MVMRLIGHGIDIVELTRITASLRSSADDFLEATFTEAERGLVGEPAEWAGYYGGRLAAKEAVVKALGTGFSGEVSWADVEILRLPSGQPEVRLSGGAKAVADGLGVTRWLLSISHSSSCAVASAVAASE
jgi:holo-[acyl-carrier protein] synthase